MKLSFHGAAGEVTGSCCLVQTARARVMVDFGLHQGGPSAERRNRRLPDVDFPRLDAAVLTHAHLDHSGRLPLLPKAGFTGRIWATPATIELTELLLKDSAAIQAMEFSRFATHRQRVGRKLTDGPLYCDPDVQAVMRQMAALSYGELKEIADGIRIRFTDAGHILGSASIEMRIRDGGMEKTIVFSGDIGVRGTPLLRDPHPPSPDGADVVILESTYGDRDHRPIAATLDEFVEILARARHDDGKVLIPAFAVGRTQTLIHHIGELIRDQRLRGVDVYIDSPMATAATDMYRRHKDLFDQATADLIDRGQALLDFPSLRFTRTIDQSRALNRLGAGAVVISASGMLTGGRILHHLKHNLWKPQTHLIFVGFQAEGSLGRRLIQGAKQVSILRENIAVKAHIHTLGGFSAHAGQSELLHWAATYRNSKPRILLNHGEDHARHALAAALRTRLDIDAVLPEHQSTVDL